MFEFDEYKNNVFLVKMFWCQVAWFFVELIIYLFLGFETMIFALVFQLFLLWFHLYLLKDKKIGV